VSRNTDVTRLYGSKCAHGGNPDVQCDCIYVPMKDKKTGTKKQNCAACF